MMNHKEFEALILREVTALLDEKEEAYCEYADGNILEDCLVIEVMDGEIKFGATIASLYEAYCSGTSMKRLAEELVKEKEDYEKMNGLEILKLLGDYDAVKEKLWIRAVNENSHSRVVKRGIYKQISDILLAVYLQVGESENQFCTTPVDCIYLDKWGLSEDAVWENAMENTMRMAQPRFYNCQELLLSYISGKCRGIPVEEFVPTFMEGQFGCFLSTDRKTGGAAAIFYPGVAKKICEVIHTDAIFIVPTSIHEVAIHDCRDIDDPNRLLEVLKHTVEEATPEQDILSWHVFKYELDIDEIREAV